MASAPPIASPSATAEAAGALSELAAGVLARVADLHVGPSDAARLKALGVCLGRRVQMIKNGDPLVVRVLGARVGLSRRLADGVVVVPG